MKRIGVIFDCDGTLIDSMGVWRELESELGRRAGRAVTPEETEILCTLTIPETGRFFHERFGLGSSDAEVVDMINEYLLGYYRERAVARPGALAFVEALAERGVALSVASASPQAYLLAGLACAGFSPYLEAVVSVDDVASSKREPTVYHHARGLMGTDLAVTWGFEDSIYAVRTLARAGYGVVGVYDRDDSATWEQLSAESDWAIRSFEEFDPDAFCEAVRTRAMRVA